MDSLKESPPNDLASYTSVGATLVNTVTSAFGLAATNTNALNSLQRLKTLLKSPGFAEFQAVVNLIQTLADAITAYGNYQNAARAVGNGAQNYIGAVTRYQTLLQTYLSINSACPPKPSPLQPSGLRLDGQWTTGLVFKHDPNAMIGPAGFGAQGFLQPDGALVYTVDFTNEATATAPAQVVTVTDQLSSNLDWNTFQLGDIGFGSTVIQVPAGLMSYSTQVDATATLGVLVGIAAGIDLETGLVTWTFTSLDPTTLDVPADPLSGFLPPDAAPPAGEGSVSYSVRPKASAETTGTQVHAMATVVFDANAPIATSNIVNTFEATPPSSTVSPLQATTNSTSFPIAWSGSDGAGSGIASYDVEVSDNGGPFTPFLTDTAATTATFTGQFGHVYGFFSAAASNVGLVQPTPSAAQATTRLVGPPTSTVNPLPATSPSPNFTVTWSGSPGPGASSIASYEIIVSDNGGPFTPFLTGTTATSATFTGAFGHTYQFTSIATDNFGDRQPTPTSAEATISVTASPSQPPASLPPSSGFGAGRDAFVTALYADILDREPEPAGLRYWAKLLARRVRPTTEAITIWNSKEHRRLVQDHTAPHVTLSRAYSEALSAWRKADKVKPAHPVGPLALMRGSRRVNLLRPTLALSNRR
jgi:uncharacterized repeat protein (TIGR01451 family)